MFATRLVSRITENFRLFSSLRFSYPRIRAAGDGAGIPTLSVLEQKKSRRNQKNFRLRQDLRASGLVQL